MIKVIFIAIGGALGTMARYIVSSIDYKFLRGGFPLGTFVVNVSGSLIAGFLCGIFEGMSASTNVKTFIFIGLLGGYTTFSAFGLESFNLFRNGQVLSAMKNILATNFTGILCVFLGYRASQVSMAFLRTIKH